MKKVLFLFALCLVAVSQANAQYSPEKNDFAVEFGFTPFSTGGDAFKLNEGMIKARYFLSGKDALRLKLGVGVDNESEKVNENYDPIDKDSPYSIWEMNTVTKNKHVDFSFMLGYERHLFVKGRFDVYAGIELGYGMSKSSGSESIEREERYFDADKKLTGSYTYVKNVDFVNESPKGNTSTSYFHGNLFAGVDVYVWKNLYLGAECGLALKTGSSPNYYSSFTEVSSSYAADGSLEESTTTIYDGVANTTTITTLRGGKSETEERNNPIMSNESSSTNFKFFVEPAIRIGWRF